MQDQQTDVTKSIWHRATISVYTSLRRSAINKVQLLLLLVLGSCVIGSQAGQSFSDHHPPPCKPYDCLMSNCPKISKFDCEEAQMGLFIKKGDPCGCCDVCVPYLRENEVCDPSRSHLLLSQGGHDTRAGCMEGLVCNKRTAKCETPTPSTKGQRWLDKGVEDSCERSMTGGEQSTYKSVLVAKVSGTSCGPGLVYRGDVDVCEKPRDTQDRVGDLVEAEADPESSYLRGVYNPIQPAVRRPVRPHSRTHRVRWSACDEPSCDRGVCPPRMLRRSMCRGRFHADRLCPCCGECSRLFTEEEEIGYGRESYSRGGGGRQFHPHAFFNATCGNMDHNCYQYSKCNESEIHKKNINKCKGMFVTRDPLRCHCCGLCKNLLVEFEECAQIVDGNPVPIRPGCNPGLECKHSTTGDGKYICSAPCPNVEECRTYNCPSDLTPKSRCEGKDKLFKTDSFCACCGICLDYLKMKEECLDKNNQPIEPGCAEYLKCVNGTCEQIATKDYVGPCKLKQSDLLIINQLEWTSPKFPQCDDHGLYYPVQCEYYKCCCVAPDGTKLGYIMPRFYAFNMLCDCARERYYGKTDLKCDHLGNYRNLDRAGIPNPLTYE